MTLEERLLAKANRMRSDPRNIMMSALQAFVYAINEKQFRPYFHVDDRRCLTLEEAKRLKAAFMRRYENGY